MSARLDALRGRSTKYEVALIGSTGERALLCYSPRSAAAVRRYIYRNADAVVAHCGADRLHPTEHGVARCGEFTIAFTGRTQREAIAHGELPFFLSTK